MISVAGVTRSPNLYSLNELLDRLPLCRVLIRRGFQFQGVGCRYWADTCKYLRVVDAGCSGLGLGVGLLRSRLGFCLFGSS